MKTGLTGLLLVCVTACVGAAQMNESAMPDDWSVISPEKLKSCASIDGDYQIFGVGRFSEGASLEESRLDAALGRTFPAGEIPARVKIVVDEVANSLNYQFTGPTNRAYSASVECSDGWYVVEQELSDQYVGDGTKLDHLLRKISLGKGSDGSLVVHVKLEGQFSSYAVLKSRESKDSWSKFKTVE